MPPKADKAPEPEKKISAKDKKRLKELEKREELEAKCKCVCLACRFVLGCVFFRCVVVQCGASVLCCVPWLARSSTVNCTVQCLVLYRVPAEYPQSTR